MGIRPSKEALARAATLLGSNRAEARTYLRRVQLRMGYHAPYSVIVSAMEQVGTDPEEVAERARSMEPPRDTGS